MMTSKSLSLWPLFLALLISGGRCSLDGSDCDKRKILNGQEGFISDGPESYQVNSQCEWLIDAGSPNKTIHLTFEVFVTECSFDFLFIYDGKSYNSRLLATLSGDSPPKPVTAYSGSMLLYLFSDRNYHMMGFEARYKIFDCPWNCSSRGQCIDHVCHCRAGYSGLGCEVVNCPDDCGEHGKCEFHTYKLQYCHCAPGYVGHKCDLQINGKEGEGQWITVQNELSGGGFSPRTSHTSVFKNGCIWIFGGFDLNDLLDELLRFCMSDNTWEVIRKPEPDPTNVNETVSWPAARNGHAMDSYGDGFFIFGGILRDGYHSDELWFFNITSMSWSLCAVDSWISPEKVTGHTLTTVEDDLYVFGGKTEIRVFTDSIFRISAKHPQQWEQLLIKGGKYPPKLRVGHSTVYHKQSRSLIVFGGFAQDSALFGERTFELHAFNIDDLYWSHLYNEDWGEDYAIPRPRAFHTGVIMGNYMVVYGGNTHSHDGIEICYNPEIFFYHLGCHVWVNHTYFTGNTSGNQMPSKGRFGHTAVVASGNVMFVIGGYSGQALGDLIAYKVPAAIADPECSSTDNTCATSVSPHLEKDHCELYVGSRNCQDDPECVFCNVGRVDGSNHSCVQRTRVNLCVAGDYHDSVDRCPGICPALHTCGACVSQGKGLELTSDVPQRRVYIQECSWCVKEAQCQTRTMPFGTCQAPEETQSGIQGWWNGLSANLTTLEQCQVNDLPAGIHWIKYKNPLNHTFPDEMSIIRKTRVTMGYTKAKQIESAFFYTSKFIGYVHPLDVSPAAGGENLTLFLGLSNAKARLYLSTDETEAAREKVITMGELSGFNILQASRGSGLPVFPNVARGHKYYIEQVTEQTPRPRGSGEGELHDTTVTLTWNGDIQKKSRQPVITSEFLEPYSNGNCNSSYNCLACLSDTLCSWCEAKHECVPRNVSTDYCQDTENQYYLITSPSECPICEYYVQCSTCAEDPLCEWVIGNGHCTRTPRNAEGAIADSSKCRPPCHQRTNCSDCIQEKGECAWCENTRTCLPFSDYVTRYIYGQCTSWVDSIGARYKCHSCASYTTCGTCLTEFGCGWCSNEFNPSIGLCLDGDFTGMFNNENTCSELLSNVYNLSSTEASLWSYDICPDMDECILGTHKCHPDATCIDVYASYKCECKRGFEGDGKEICDKTCYHECVHGKCSGPPEFKCECELGWTNHSCDVDCGCNNHSTCVTEVGLCDYCQHRTAGPTCAECMPGAYGNPLDPQGCHPCNCNEHGDLSMGECDNRTGECYCMDNTKGIHCEHCKKNYYGNPRNGGKCYLRCDNRMFVTNVTEGALGSYRGSGVDNRAHVYCLWVLTVYPDVLHTLPDSGPRASIALTIEGDMMIECGQDAVYVFDGVPDFIFAGVTGHSKPLAEFCGMAPGKDMTVYGGGTLTVFLEGNMIRQRSSRGFNASFKAYVCPENCHGNRECIEGRCECKNGYWGMNCQVPICPFNCSEKQGRGYCLHGLCICNRGFGGVGCRDQTSPKEMQIQVLSDVSLFNSPIGMSADQKLGLYPEFAYGPEDIAPCARAGHTVTTCGDGLIFLFGGYSAKGGFLNDMWILNASDKRWTMVEPTTKGPKGRYHHAAACIPALKMIFIYGGFEETVVDRMKKTTLVHPTNSMFKFNIESHAWTRHTTTSWLPALAGHSLTHVGALNLIIVGGFSSENYFSSKVYEYNASNGFLAWQEFNRTQMSGSIPIGVYGHSAVYDTSTETIYIFGGYLFRSDQWAVSGELFSLGVRTREWNMLYPDAYSEWETRVFHTAVHVGDAMVVIGGLTLSGNYATSVMVYRYACNTWHKLEYNGFDHEQSTISVLGLDAVSLGNIIYIFGGFAGFAISTLSQLTLPRDICALITDDIVCSKISGCQLCVLTLESGENTTVCYDSHRSNSTRPPGCVGVSPEKKRCNLNNHQKRKCQRYTKCSECLASHPHFKEHEPSCVWCTNCPTGSCVRKGEACPAQKSCPMTQHVIAAVEDCFEYMCPASDCEKCADLETCLWTRHFQRSSEIGRYFSQSPVYAWNCVANTLKPAKPTKFQSMPPEKCPARCYTYGNCESCLDSNGSEGGSHECIWSQELQQCMPPVYLYLRCSMGECGFIHMGQPSVCPSRCETNIKCADCITTPGCGWCAFGGTNGEGVCMPGGLAPTQGGVCSEGNISVSIPFVDVISEIKGQPEVHTPHIGSPVWSFDECPPENECLNNHHTCNPQTQDCRDTAKHFGCECKQGYVMNAGSSNCEPVCHEGCVRGVCVKPDECHCDFGWIGKNCSVECQCNKHSNCLSVSQPGDCLDCKNNTKGAKCEFCEPLFVGNPVNGGRCIPCLEFCHNHSDECMTQHQYDLSLLQNRVPISSADRKAAYYHLLQQGPKEFEAVCFKCLHNTTGKRCESCTSGHFRKLNEDKTKPCRECHCNGHSNVCNVDTGENCQCKNNTETNCESKDEADCWEYQCAQCKEYFLGVPTNGHQCYRQMNVDRDYCFDPDTQNNCNQFPKALKLGRTVFFAVQPKYLNVDIRITIDVTMGSADVFISNKKDTFQVFLDKSSWFHNIYLDRIYASGRAGLARRSITDGLDGSQFNDDAIRERLQLHESGSVLITDQVPEYLKLKASDTEFYKMSQFESMEKSASKSSSIKGSMKGQRNNKTDDVAKSSNNSKLRRKSTEQSKGRFSQRHDVGKGLKKQGRHRLKAKKARKLHYRTIADKLHKQPDFLKDLDADDLESLFLLVNGLHASPSIENESVRPPSYGDWLARYKNMTVNKKRHRRGITVTDTRKDGKSAGAASGIKMGEINAGELNTYITVGQQNSVLVVRDVRFRLVITLPRDQHDLRSSRFYIIVRSRGGNADNSTYGNLYFRQDQPHIDLFVFFSVFFSCFFLFLAVCVMLWKMKQTFDARRSRQMREREMECMASRPFARILVLVEHDEPGYVPLTSGLMRRRLRLGRYPSRNQYYNNNDINIMSSLPPTRDLGVIPIAIEPTENGLAAVGTVLFQLPGGAAAPAQLCLGSSLTTRILHPLPAQKSGTLRRRTSASSC